MTGDVKTGIVGKRPIEGVDMLLGNDLAVVDRLKYAQCCVKNLWQVTHVRCQLVSQNYTQSVMRPELWLQKQRESQNDLICVR